MVSVTAALHELAAARGFEGHRALAAALAEDADPIAVADVADALDDEAPRVKEAALAVLGFLAAASPSLVAAQCDAIATCVAPDASEATWRAVVALAEVAPHDSVSVARYAETIVDAIHGGSVIAADHGVTALAWASTVRDDIVPHLISELATCEPSHVCLRGERCLPAVTAETAEEFMAVLDSREPELSRSAAARLRRLVREVERSGTQGQ